MVWGVGKDVGRDGIDFGLHVANARGAKQTEFGRSADNDSPRFGANDLEINAPGNGGLSSIESQGKRDSSAKACLGITKFWGFSGSWEACATVSEKFSRGKNSL